MILAQIRAEIATVASDDIQNAQAPDRHGRVLVSFTSIRKRYANPKHTLSTQAIKEVEASLGRVDALLAEVETAPQ